MKRNRDRVFDELVALEAWHSPFDDEGKASLHVDVTFRQGKIGKEEQAKVRFEVYLTRAEVLFSFDQTEAVKVLQGSVDREAIPRGKVIERSKSEKSGDARAGMAVAVGVKPKADISAAASLSARDESERLTEFEDEIRMIRSRQYRDTGGFYTWELRHAMEGRAIIGKVWDPKQEPRLTFKKSTSKLPPATHVLVRCRREDLRIDKIEPKREAAIIDRFKSNRQAAAEAAIKHILEELDLEHGDLSEKYSGLNLADAIVDEEVT